MDIGLIIPAYNVETTIVKVLQGISDSVLDTYKEILLIDNNSQDRTLEVVKEFLRHHSNLAKKLTILKHDQNYGYGSSIKTGFEHFLNRDVDYIMIIHGDNQSDPQKISKNYLSELEKDSNLDVILGSRFLPGSDIKNYSLFRKVGNYGFNFLTYMITGLKMSDSGTAIVLIRKSLLKNIPFLSFSNTWQFHPQLNIFLYRDPKIKRREVVLDWADSEAKSSINLIQYSFKLLRILLEYRFKRSILKVEDQLLFKPEPIVEYRHFKII